MKYYIYTLDCPITNQIRYIGKSNNPEKRLKHHIAYKGKCHKTSWIKSLKGLKPILSILDETGCEKEAYKLEQYWISQLKSWGFRLVNTTEGGEGFSGMDVTGENNTNAKITEETAKKIVKDLSQDILSLREIQEKYNVGLGIVGNIKYGKIWKHLTKGLVFEKQKRKPQGNINRANSLKSKGVYDSLSVKIEQYSLDGTFINTYNSISEAALKTNTNRSSISSCISNKLKSSNNFIWKRKL